MDDPGKYMVNDSEAKAAVLEILAKGHSVELPATGLSMFPTFRPGDRVVVRPLRKDEMPEKGEVVVFIETGVTALRQNGVTAEINPGVFVMHRLISITEDEMGERWCITRGDSRREADRPWQIQQLIGVAVSYRSGKKEKEIKSYIPSEFRYKLNWWLLWGWGKIRTHMQE